MNFPFVLSALADHNTKYFVTYISLSKGVEVQMSERLMAIAKTYTSGDPDSMLWVVPSAVRKALKIKKGERFTVKIDDKDRVIYERLEGVKEE